MSLSHNFMSDPVLKVASRVGNTEGFSQKLSMMTTTPPSVHKMKLELNKFPSQTVSETSIASSPNPSSLAFPDVKRRSSSELAAAVRDAYDVLFEKEKDLRLATEIGRSLLEDNMDIQAKYEQLLQHYQASSHAFQKQLPQYLHPDRKSSMQPGQHSSCFNKGSKVEWVTSAQRPHVDTNQGNIYPDYGGVQPMSNHHTDDATTGMLASGNNSYKVARVVENEEARQMLQEIETFQQELEKALQTMEALENERFKNLALIATISRDPTRYYYPSTDEKDFTAEDLSKKIESLHNDHHHLVLAKMSADQRLEKAKKSLQRLKEELVTVGGADDKLKVCQRAIEQQRLQNERMNESIEEYRTILAHVRDRDLWSADDDVSQQFSLRAPSVTGSSDYSLSDVYELQKRREQELGSLKDECATDQAMQKPSEINLANCQPIWKQENLGPFLNNHDQTEPGAFSNAHTGDTQFSFDKPWIERVKAPNSTFYDMPTLCYTPEHLTDDGGQSESSFDTVQPSPLFSTGFPHDTDDDQGSILSSATSQTGQLKHTVIRDQDDTHPSETTDSLYPTIPEDAAGSVAMYKRTHSIHWQNVAVPAEIKDGPPRKGILRSLLWLPLLIPATLWSWFRFSLVMTLAIVISVWYGPDAILEKQQPVRI